MKENIITVRALRAIGVEFTKLNLNDCKVDEIVDLSRKTGNINYNKIQWIEIENSIL